MKTAAKRALCALLSLMLALACACSKKAPTKEEAQAMANENAYALAARELVLNICEDYYSLESHVLKTDIGNDNSACVWPFASFLEALSDVYALFPNDEVVKKYYVDALDFGLSGFKVTEKITYPTGSSIETYYNAVYHSAGDYYYDDDAWVCFQLLRAYELLCDEKYLQEAEQTLKFFKTGIDGALGGGVYWDKRYNSKNSCADGPVAICFLTAYQITKNEDYLNTAKDIVTWLNATLRDSDGLYSDNINLAGEINGWKADYNQGTPLYALCLLYEITGDKSCYDLAKTTAEAALTNGFRIYGKNGAKASKNGNPIYKSWCVGWLMRGFYQYVKMTGEAGKYFFAMEYVLDNKTLPNKDENGYYDPYFGSNDWQSESKTDVLQPCGVASVMAQCALYDIYLAPYVK